MVNITKIVEKSLQSSDATRPVVSEKLVNIFGVEDKVKKR